MPRFIKKPVIIEAYQFDGASVYREMPPWLKAAVDAGNVFMKAGAINRLFIKTLEGVMTASIDDWIIQGIKGEIYPCKPDIFAATYEPA